MLRKKSRQLAATQYAARHDALLMNDEHKLHLAALLNDATQIEQLLDQSYDVNAGSHFFGTPLHIAVKNECIVAMECLLKNGADPLAHDSNGKSPLDCAIATKNPEVGNLLTQYNIIPDLSKVETTSSKSLPPFLSDEDLCTLLITAIVEQELEDIQRYLKAGARIDFTSQTILVSPLDHALSLDNAAIVELLLAATEVKEERPNPSSESKEKDEPSADDFVSLDSSADESEDKHTPLDKTDDAGIPAVVAPATDNSLTSQHHASMFGKAAKAKKKIVARVTGDPQRQPLLDSEKETGDEHTRSLKNMVHRSRKYTVV